MSLKYIYELVFLHVEQTSVTYFKLWYNQETHESHGHEWGTETALAYTLDSVYQRRIAARSFFAVLVCHQSSNGQSMN